MPDPGDANLAQAALSETMGAPGAPARFVNSVGIQTLVMNFA